MTLIKRNLLANFLGQAWVAVMNLAFIPLIIGYVGIEAYGLVGVFAILMAALPLVDMGMTPTLGREMARFTAGAHTPQSIGDLLRSLELICFSIAFVLAAGVWAASGVIASGWLQSQQLPLDAVAQALSIMALVVGLRLCEGVYRSALLGLQRQVLFNSINAALATLRHGGAVVVLALVSPTIQAFFLWQAIASFVSIIALAVTLHRVLPTPPARPEFRWSALSEVWRFASGMLGITLLATLLTQTDKLLLSRLLTLTDFGYYSLAATLASSLSLIITPVTQAIYPRMVELASLNDEAQLATLYHRGSQLVTVLIAPAVSLLSFYGQGVIFVWSGDATLAAHTGPILSVIVIGTFLNGLMWMPYQCQLAHGWTSLALRSNLVAVCVLVPAILFVAPRYGAVGTAWIWVLLNAGYVAINVQIMHRRLLKAEKWRWYGADVLLPTLGAVGIAMASRLIAPTPLSDRLHWAGFVVVVGVLALLGSLLTSDRLRHAVLSRYTVLMRR